MTFPNLNTQRLHLRSMLESDEDNVLFLRSNIEVNQFIKRPPTTNIEEARKFILKMQNSFNKGINLYWVICLNEKNTMIGSICLWNFSSDGTKAEVGYDLNPEFQHKGIMSEALSAVIKFAFNKLNLMEISAYTQYNNLASIKLLTRHNFFLKVDETDDDNKDNRIYAVRRIK